MLAEVLIVRADVAPLAAGVTEAGLKVHADPLGKPEQLSVTGLANPLSDVRVTVAVADSPGVTEAGVVAEDAIWKSATVMANVE